MKDAEALAALHGCELMYGEHPRKTTYMAVLRISRPDALEAIGARIVAHIEKMVANDWVDHDARP